MRFNLWITCLTAGALLAITPVFATAAIAHEQLQVPQCLAAKIATSYETLAENEQFKIIDVLASDVDALSHLADEVRCGRFVNVSHRMGSSALVIKKNAAKNILQNSLNKLIHKNTPIYYIQHQPEVNLALQSVVAANIWQTLSHLTTYYNRSPIKESGVKTANWLKTQFESMAAKYGRTDTTTFFVPTGTYKQPSLVTVIGSNINAPGIVIGAHMDTLEGRMPGAGDDGSGSASIMEMARVLLASNLTFKRPIYIIWYAAEERGLVGSQFVVNYFKKHAIPVSAVVQFDMTGYRVNPADPTMWVFTDHTDWNLSNFLAELIHTYVHVPVDYSQCGYGCSDHASWDDVNIPAAFPCESNFEEHNPYIHSEHDTMDLLSLEHMTNFSKLAVAFAIELASE